MRPHRPAELEFVNKVGEERVHFAAAAETAEVRSADRERVRAVMAIGVFEFEAPRTLLVTDTRPDRISGIEAFGGRRYSGSRYLLVLQQGPSAFAAEIECLGPRRHDGQDDGRSETCAARDRDPPRHCLFPLWMFPGSPKPTGDHQPSVYARKRKNNPLLTGRRREEIA